MPISTLCKNINFTDMSHVGKCFTEFVFFGAGDLAALTIIILFVLVGVKAQLPLEVWLPAFLGLSFVLWLMVGAAWLMGFFLLGLLVGGVLLALAILNYLARS